jgi:hypothetical protein
MEGAIVASGVTGGPAMVITFIKPTLGRLADGAPFMDAARMAPLQLAVLAGLTPAAVDVIG